jgi:replicative superfamily II helicase
MFTTLVSLLNLNLVIIIYLVLWLQKDVSKAKSREVVEFFESGFGIHNAGMMRSDRSLMERLFAEGLLKVSFCATFSSLSVC